MKRTRKPSRPRIPLGKTQDRSGRPAHHGAGYDSRGRVISWAKVMREINAGCRHFWRQRPHADPDHRTHYTAP